jgi:hypothetical protein
MAKTQGGLTKWHNENWVDIKTGKPCGRQEGENRDYPACRPKKVADKMTKSEKQTAASKKTGSEQVEYAVTASGRRRQKAAMGGYTQRWSKARGNN